MRPPPLALLAALGFWGWQSGLLAPGLVLGLLLEAHRLAPVRFGFGSADFNRGADLSLVLAAGATVWLFLTPRSVPMYLDLSLWAPLLLAPLALLQAWAEAPRVRLLALLPSPRPGVRARWLDRSHGVAVNLSYPYMFVCLASAGMANHRSPAFFLAALALAGYCLWAVRPARHRAATFVLALVLAAALGWTAQWQLHHLQERVRGWVRNRTTNPFQAITGIGEMGELKLSQDVVLRVRADLAPGQRSLLLRSAAYDFYGRGTWQSTSVEFLPLAPLPGEEGGWVVDGDAEPTTLQSVTVFHQFSRPDGLLALPAGTIRLHGMPSGEAEVNRLGAVLVDEAPGLAGYRAEYVSFADTMAPPAAADEVVPPKEQGAMDAVIAELGLKGEPPEAVVRKLVRFFYENFDYSLRLQPGDEGTPIAHFLQTSRSGHCEYFATAAALVLRRAGIPARYVTGYSVQEFEPATDLYVVRYSHAHAWTAAWIDGAWQQLDPTPPLWVAADVKADGLWRRLADWRARLAFRFQRWRWLSEDDTVRLALLGLTVPLGLFLLWRMWRRGGLRRVAGPSGRFRAGVPGAESAFYMVEDRLARSVGPRRPSETMGGWLRRLDRGELMDLARMHYRWRFDPRGVSQKEKRRLERAVRQWLDGQ